MCGTVWFIGRGILEPGKISSKTGSQKDRYPFWGAAKMFVDLGQLVIDPGVLVGPRDPPWNLTFGRFLKDHFAFKGTRSQFHVSWEDADRCTPYESFGFNYSPR